MNLHLQVFVHYVCCFAVLQVSFFTRTGMFEQAMVKASDQGPKAPRSLGGHIRHIDSKAYHEVCKHMNKMSESMLGYLEYFSKFIFC